MFSETAGSFSRTGNYPLEANYIFPSEQALIDFYTDPLNKTTLHRGLLKLVAIENGNQALYWVVRNSVGELEFQKLLEESNTTIILNKLEELQTKIQQEIEFRTQGDTLLLGADNINTLPQNLRNISQLATAIEALKDQIRPLQTNNENTLVPLTVVKQNDAYVVSGSLKLSSSDGNQLQKNPDGLFHNVNMEYSNGYLDLKINGNTVKQLNIGLSQLIKSANYDPVTGQLILIFKKGNGEHKVEIPLGSLVSEFTVSNSTQSPIVLEKSRVINGPDLLSADVKISTANANILVKRDGILEVIGTTDNIKHNGQVLKDFLATVVNTDVGQIQQDVTTLQGEVTTVRESINTLTNTVQSTTSRLDNTIDSIEIKNKPAVDENTLISYYLSINNQEKGEIINIPKTKQVKGFTSRTVTDLNQPYENAKIGDKYIELLFTDNTKMYLPVTSFETQYTGENGLQLHNNTFSIKLTPNEEFLEATPQGLGTKGIVEAITSKAQELIAVIDTKAPINSPEFTGTPTLTETLSDDDNSTKIPNTKWVHKTVQKSIAEEFDNLWNIIN